MGIDSPIRFAYHVRTFSIVNTHTCYQLMKAVLRDKELQNGGDSDASNAARVRRRYRHLTSILARLRRACKRACSGSVVVMKLDIAKAWNTQCHIRHEQHQYYALQDPTDISQAVPHDTSPLTTRPFPTATDG